MMMTGNGNGEVDDIPAFELGKENLTNYPMKLWVLSMVVSD